MAGAPELDEIVASLSQARPGLDPDEQRHALTLLRTLAEGESVSMAQYAERSGLTAEEASSFVDGVPGVYRDEDGAVIGFWGLTVVEMPPHRYRLDGRELFTWCAWDPFIITPLLGGSAEVASVDANTGDEVALTIVEGDVADLSHPGLTVSFTLPEEWTEDVIATFCHVIHYFTDPDSAHAWTDAHPGTFVLSLDDAVALGEAWRQQVLPDVTEESG